jgi:UPF0271 protein
VTARIDLNCDLGESAERIADGTDRHLLATISSANVACGGHAGDRTTMEAVVRAAFARGVAIGAHPSYVDRASFGRSRMTLEPDDVAALVEAQVRALHAIARAAGAELAHVKPHGALYHAAAQDARIAEAIARGSARVRSGLILVGAAGSQALAVWGELGFATAAEGFADRAYEPDGTLRARSLPGALIADPARAAAQALRIAREGSVVTGDGSLRRIVATTLCVHGDTPGAPRIARAVRTALESAGIEVAAPQRT